MATDYSVKIKLETLLGDRGIQDLDTGLNNAMTRGKASVRGLTDAFGPLGAAIKNVLASLAAYASIQGIKGMATSIIDVGAEFEQMMLKVRASTQATDEEFERLNAVAIKLGAETEFSASQASQALNYLTMAGLDVEQAIEAIPNTMNLATAGVIDMGQAADITTGILFGMGLQVSDLERVNDVLVKTFTSSNQSISDLGEAFKYVGPISKSFGVEIETVAVFLGELANAGIKGQMAGTALRSAFLDTSKVFDKLGVSAKDAEGNTKNLIDAMELMIQKDYSPEQVVDIFGERAGPAVLALMQTMRQDSGKLAREIEDMMTNAAGSTQKAADVIRDSYKVALDEVGGALESIKIEVFRENQDALKEALSGLAKVIRDNSKEIKSYAQSVMDAAKFGIQLVAALVDVAKWFQESLVGIGAINAAMAAFATVIGTKVIVGLVNYIIQLKRTLIEMNAQVQLQRAATVQQKAREASLAREIMLITQLNAQLKAGTITTAGYNNQLKFMTFQYGAANVAAAKLVVTQRAATAATLSFGAAVRGLYTLIGGPMGLAIIGITAAVTAYMTWRDSIDRTREALEEQNRTLFDSHQALGSYIERLAEIKLKQDELAATPVSSETQKKQLELVKQERQIYVDFTKDERSSAEYRALGETATREDFIKEYSRVLTTFHTDTRKLVEGWLVEGLEDIDIKGARTKIQQITALINEKSAYGATSVNLEYDYAQLEEAEKALGVEMEKLNKVVGLKIQEFRNEMKKQVDAGIRDAESADILVSAYAKHMQQIYQEMGQGKFFDTSLVTENIHSVTDLIATIGEQFEETTKSVQVQAISLENSMVKIFETIRKSAEGLTGLQFFEATEIAMQAEKAGKDIVDEVETWKKAIEEQTKAIELRLNVEGLDPAERQKLEAEVISLNDSIKRLETDHQQAMVEIAADAQGKIAVLREEQLRGVKLSEDDKSKLYKSTAKIFITAEQERAEAGINSQINVELAVIASCDAIIAKYQQMAMAGQIAGAALALALTTQAQLRAPAEGRLEDLNRQLEDSRRVFEQARTNLDSLQVSSGRSRGGGGGGGSAKREEDDSAEIARVAAERAKWEAERAVEDIKQAFKQGDADISQFLAQVMASRKQLYDADVAAAQAAVAKAAKGSASEQARAQLALDQAMAAGARSTEEAYKETFETIQQAYSELISKINSESSAIQLNVELGFLSEAQGRDQMRELIGNNESALNGMIAAMEQLKVSAEAAGVTMDFTGPITQSRSALEQLKVPLNEIGTNINGVIRSSITGMLGDIASGTMTLGEALRQFLLNIAQGLAEIAAQQIASGLMNMIGGGAGGGIGGFLAGIFGAFAEGGPVRGPGTATSDSILARLSNGEYVINAKAVKFWGSDFLEQLNKMIKFDPSHLIKGFAEGGYVGNASALTKTLVNNSSNFSKFLESSAPTNLKVDVGVKAEVDKDKLIKVLVDHPSFSKGVQKSNTREKRSLSSMLSE